MKVRLLLGLIVFPAVLGAAEPVQLIAGRPTDRTLDLSLLSRENRTVSVEYGDRRIPVTLKANEAATVRLDGLPPDAQVNYRLVLPDGTTQAFSCHTRRRPGEAFVFALQGDSHPERPHQFDPAAYRRTLAYAASDRPDFYFLLGDDFSVDTLKVLNRDAVEALYRNQRDYLTALGAPLFLVNGNHEQAARCNLDGTADNVAVWARNAREKYFPQPAPDDFYAGDPELTPHIGLARDYFAWEWGDALFVVLDPYWHSPDAADNRLGSRDKSPDPCGATLGEAQYRWLGETLARSRAKYKFILIHHLNGRGRGGVECATLYEWGGRNRKGIAGFSIHRPGWELPIHDLLVKYRVDAVFQGHDHIYARQELDGVAYFTLPLPAGPAGFAENFEAYRSGKVLPGPGYLRVKVAPAAAEVEFVSGLTGEILDRQQFATKE